jgi:uncharacterized membrane protein
VFENRPKIDLPLSPDKTLSTIGKTLLVFLWGLTIYSIVTLPETIPIHFDIQGNVNGWGSAKILLFMPIFATGLYFLLNYITKYAHIFNYPVPITPENALRQYTNGVQMIRVIAVVLCIVFFILLVEINLIARGVINNIGTWDLPLVLSIIFIPLIYFIVKAFKMK